ncbi:serine hydrolase domain-containing protein [Rhodovibrionaceae bacterium A322]
MSPFAKTLPALFYLLACLPGPFLDAPSAQILPLDDGLRDAFAQGKLPKLHGAIIDLGDARLAEVYFPGDDQVWGRPLGVVEHGPEELHDLRSVTKSMVGLLYGIALDQGKVPGPDQPLYAQFPDYPDLQKEPGRDRILISHALTMQMGLEWNENLPYSDPRNSEIAMERAPERYRFILEQPIREAPGQSWIYSGGATALIGRIIANGTGQSLDDFAKDHLFHPLGITSFEWIAGADGEPSAASGLRLTLPDLAKIGHMLAQDGLYDGQRIVSQDWLEESFQPHASFNRDVDYGYFWYVFGTEEKKMVFASGNGGQRLTVQGDVDLITAVFAGRYNDHQGWHTPFSVLIDHAIPEAKKRLGR